MTDKGTDLGGRFWAQSLDNVDREVVRLASICKVRLLDAGVIDRVLKNDATVCGTQNQVAFEKLRNALMMHYHVRGKAVQSVGEQATQDMITEIVENLRKRIGGQLGGSK